MTLRITTFFFFIIVVYYTFHRFNDSEMSNAVSQLIVKSVSGITTQNCAQQFSWLLHAEIPLLFSPNVPGNKGVGQNFRTSLQKSIEVKRLRKEVQQCLLDWMVCISMCVIIVFIYSSYFLYFHFFP